MRISLVLENILTYLGVKSCTKVTYAPGIQDTNDIVYVYVLQTRTKRGRRHKATRVTCEQASLELHVPLSVSLRLLPRTVFFLIVLSPTLLSLIHAQVIRKTTLTLL